MARKTERWVEVVDEDVQKFMRAHFELSPRELSIVVGATLELALVEMIERRLRGSPTEIEEFLGTNGDGRAPAGSFGARIQLAYHIGLITQHDANVLRRVKAIRNIFAHRVNASFASREIVKELAQLSTAWLRAMKNPAERIAKVSEDITSGRDSGQGIFLAVFATYHFYFQGNIPDVKTVDALSHVVGSDGRDDIGQV